MVDHDSRDLVRIAQFWAKGPDPGEAATDVQKLARAWLDLRVKNAETVCVAERAAARASALAEYLAELERTLRRSAERMLTWSLPTPDRLAKAYRARADEMRAVLDCGSAAPASAALTPAGLAKVLREEADRRRARVHALAAYQHGIVPDSEAEATVAGRKGASPAEALVASLLEWAERHRGGGCIEPVAGSAPVVDYRTAFTKILDEVAHGIAERARAGTTTLHAEVGLGHVPETQVDAATPPPPACGCEYHPSLLGAQVSNPPGWSCTSCGGVISCARVACECEYRPDLLEAWVPNPPGWRCRRCGGFIPRTLAVPGAFHP